MHPFAPAQIQPAPPAQTPLGAAIEAMGRPVEVYDVDGFFGPGNKPVPKLAIRVPSIGEQSAAVQDAHKALENASTEAAKSDDDALLNEKQVELLWRACRDAENPKGPAFVGPKWMRDNLTTDQLAGLLNLLGLTRRKHGPGGMRGSTVEEVDAFARQLHASDPADAYVALAKTAREDLYGVVLVLASKYVALTGEVEALRMALPPDEPDPPAEE